jgi:TolA-binding protein
MAQKSDQPPADERTYDTGSFEAELLWYKHRWTILFGVAIVLASAAAVAIWLFSKHSARLAAEALFAEAKEPVAWREVIARYPSSPAAAGAHFLLADSLRAKELKESSSLYEKILTNFPTSPLVGGARLGLAENLALAGETKEALAALRELQSRDPASYAAPFAFLLEGRALIDRGKFDEARKVLSNLLSTYPKSPSARAAGVQLDALVPFLGPEAQKSTQ